MIEELQKPNAQTSGALSVWVLTDGKIGDDVQCLAIARGLAPDFQKRVINPRLLFAAMAPWGPVDPRDGAAKLSSPIAPPFPDVVVASGRRAIPYARAVKQASNGAANIVIMKDPRLGRGFADVIWAPAHDQLSGANVISTLTSPHEMSARVALARANPLPQIAVLPRPMLGIVLGGDSAGMRYRRDDISRLAAKLGAATGGFASVAVTPSRRTPPAMLNAVEAAIIGKPAIVWHGAGANPYADILASSDALVVTADSHNMMSEALTAGVGVYAFRPDGLSAKLGAFVDDLENTGAIRTLEDAVTPFRATALDATPRILAEIRRRLLRSN